MILFNCDSISLNEYLNSNEVQKFEWGEAFWIHEPSVSSHNRASVAITKHFPNMIQEKHFHMSEEQIIYVVEGEGVHIINGEKNNINKSMFLYCPPYTEHEVINTGKTDLVLVVVYVPTKLRTLENRNTGVSHIDLQDFLSLEFLSKIEQELSMALQLNVNFLDVHQNEIIRKDFKDGFCTICQSSYVCSKQKYISDNTINIFDSLYRCDFGLGEIEIPINVDDKILGYISCKGFIIGDIKEVEGKLLELSQVRDVSYMEVKNKFYNNQTLLKSRMYAIEEMIDEMIRFIKAIIDRKYFEKELVQKDWEILENAKEKLQLKDKLREANIELSYQKMFSIKEDSFKEDFYPYFVEIEIGNAIKKMNFDKIIEIKKNNQNKYKNSKSIVEEMIIILIRTVLLDFISFDSSIKFRQKYLSLLNRLNKESEAWDVLVEFCLECINIIKNGLEDNNIMLIDKINNYISLNYDKELNLNLIAETFFISPNYLSTIFNEENGISLTEYINILRIEEAKKYLVNTNLKIKDIARKIGYSNDSYFINVFRNLVNMTPGVYRRKCGIQSK